MSKMNKYEDKEAAMDDYSHEKKLGADARYDMEHGHGEWAGADIDHAAALKRDAHDDALHRHAREKVLRHMHGRKS